MKSYTCFCLQIYSFIRNIAVVPIMGYNAVEKVVEGFSQDANGRGCDRLTNSQVIIVRAIARKNPGADVHAMIHMIGRALSRTDPAEIYAKSIKAGILPPISETTERRLNDLAALWKYTIENRTGGIKK